MHHLLKLDSFTALPSKDQNSAPLTCFSLRKTQAQSDQSEVRVEPHRGSGGERTSWTSVKIKATPALVKKGSRSRHRDVAAAVVQAGGRARPDL